MARPGFRQHPKFKRLVHLLREPVPHVWGYCECLWDVAYQSGDAVIGDTLDVELAAEFPGEPGKLTKALLDCRLIDAFEDGRYAIHDLFENAPEFVKKRFTRDQARKNKYSPRSRPRSGNRPPNSAIGQTSAELGATHSTAQDLGALGGVQGRSGARFSPVDEKISSQEKDARPCASQSAPEGGSGGAAKSRSAERERTQHLDAQFERFWEAYPRKPHSFEKSKKKARLVWRDLNPDDEMFAMILAAVEAQKKSDQWTRGYIVNPVEWLSNERWTDAL